MAVVFFGLGEDREGWEWLGRVEDGKITADSTGELRETIEPAYDLADEQYLSRALNNHYLNAIVVDDETFTEPNNGEA